jgi:hypothetical protein
MHTCESMLRHMRTTIILPDEFYRVVRDRARAEGRTFTSFLEEALREHLSRLDARSESSEFAVTPYRGAGLHAGVDLADSTALLDRMER